MQHYVQHSFSTQGNQIGFAPVCGYAMWSKDSINERMVGFREEQDGITKI
jgi:hypothetical protein